MYITYSLQKIIYLTVRSSWKEFHKCSFVT